MRNKSLTLNQLESVNEPMTKVFPIGDINSPNPKLKSIIKDVKVILCRKIVILCRKIAILCHKIAIPWHRTKNVTGRDELCNLTKKTFLPIRWQKISGKKSWWVWNRRKQVLYLFYCNQCCINRTICSGHCDQIVSCDK